VEVVGQGVVRVVRGEDHGGWVYPNDRPRFLLWFGDHCAPEAAFPKETDVSKSCCISRRGIPHRRPGKRGRLRHPYPIRRTSRQIATLNGC